MIAQIQGKLIEKNPTNLLIDCNGVGYEIKITLNTFTAIPDQEFIKVNTRLIVREDAHILYGFHTKEEREMFNFLISVSGIGPNTAMIMLSSLTPAEVAHAIQVDDVATIQGVKGIGAKTAQRVIIDLKGKVLGFESGMENITGGGNTNRFDALNALVSLGFDKKAADKTLNKLDAGASTVEGLIKEALKLL
ncbi:MAG: Holliday junction branch migration protein RuvA [Crocinitomicaceae bacterium]|jgi:Holliday junction DNA helicase RuvA|tara:strand:- start:8057 stop:8632 length:576 start_codon:yes stop_codon:yes gene_type:complete